MCCNPFLDLGAKVVTRIRTTEGNKDGKGVKDGKRGKDGKSPPHKKQGLRRSGPYRRIMLHVQQWAKWLKRQTPRGLRARKLDVTIGQGDRCKGLLSLRLRRRATPPLCCAGGRRPQLPSTTKRPVWFYAKRWDEAIGPCARRQVPDVCRAFTFRAVSLPSVPYQSKSDALSTCDERALSG